MEINARMNRLEEHLTSAEHRLDSVESNLLSIGDRLDNLTKHISWLLEREKRNA